MVSMWTCMWTGKNHCRAINKVKFNMEYPYPQNCPPLWICHWWCALPKSGFPAILLPSLISPSLTSLPDISPCLPSSSPSSKAVYPQIKFISLSCEEPFAQPFLQTMLTWSMISSTDTVNNDNDNDWTCTCQTLFINVFPGWMCLFLITTLKEVAVTIPILQMRKLRNKEVEKFC